jgi:hypothetical protein
MAGHSPGILFVRNLVAQMVRAQDSYPLASGRQFDPAPRYKATFGWLFLFI